MRSRSRGIRRRRRLKFPTVSIHGEQDHCEVLETTEGSEEHFTGHYGRAVLKGVGHFPQRESPRVAAEAILRHVRSQS